MTELHQDSVSEQIERIIGKDPRVLGTFEYRHILSEVHALEVENAKLKDERDSIAASFREVAWKLSGKAFPMTPRDEAEACVTMCDVQEVFRALSAASARRQLQLDLINRAIEEAEWWQKLTGLDILSECDIPGCQSCARMTSLKSQRTRLESEIAALEAQQARETP